MELIEVPEEEVQNQLKKRLPLFQDALCHLRGLLLAELLLALADGLAELLLDLLRRLAEVVPDLVYTNV